jgi:chromosome segregation ATPase
MTDEMTQDQKYLMQLWDGYEKLESELTEARSSLKEMEGRDREKERVIATLRELLEAKDSELRKHELGKASATDKVEDLQVRVRELEETLQVERNRYKKLYYLTEEMDQEVARLRKALEERDNWFKDNLSFLEEMPDRIRKWREISARTSVRKTLLDTLAPENERIAIPPLQKEEPQFQKVDPRSEAIKTFSSLPGMDEARASVLFDAGYTSMDSLKKAEPFDLVKLEGITPTIARKVHQAIHA